MYSELKNEWLPIEGYEGIYEVSNYGQVKRVSLTHPGTSLRFLKGSKTNGYSGIFLYKNGKGKHFFIHRLVMKAFVGDPKDNMVVNHIDGCKTNNIITNLEYATLAENNLHAYESGLKIGANRKLTEKNILEMLEMKPVHSYNFIAEKYGVHIGTIVQIFHGKTYKKITKDHPNVRKCGRKDV